MFDFPTHNQLPPLVRDIVREASLEAMAPGETTWSPPWMLEATEEGDVVLKGSMIDRGKTPGGTVTLKLVSDFDGIYVDASALSQKDLQECLKPGSKGTTMGDDGERTRVGGVLYPLISNSDGLEPDDVRQFNKEQQELRKRFSDYYKQTYGMDYTFAEYEAHRPYSALPSHLGELATGSQKPKRWGWTR